MSVKTIETTIETLKIIEDCANCKDKEVGRSRFDKLIGILNQICKKVLCKGCKEEIEKLTDKCGNREIAKFLYQCRLDREWFVNGRIQWIPFDEFKNIEYLAKGDFGEVHKATRFYHQDYQEVVLERIHNSNDTIKL